MGTVIVSRTLSACSRVIFVRALFVDFVLDRASTLSSQSWSSTFSS